MSPSEVFEETLLIPYKATEPRVEKLLVFAPHPDDEVFGCGGLSALTVRRGGQVFPVVLTGGGAGNFSGAERNEEYLKTRRRESEEAARILGTERPLFLDFADRSLSGRVAELVVAMTKLITEHSPAGILAPSPSELHPDHHAVAVAAFEAFRAAGPKGPSRLLFYEVSSPLAPNALVVIDEAKERKDRAGRAFASQLRERPYVDQMKGLNRYRSLTLPQGVEQVEAFHVVTRAEAGLAWEAVEERAGYRWRRPRPEPRLSVVVTTCDRPETLPLLLERLAAQRTDVAGGAEIILVDAGPVGDEKDRIAVWAREDPELVVLREGGNGPAAARNRGLSTARGEVVLFLSDRALPEAGLLAAHERAHKGAGGERLAVQGGIVNGLRGEPGSLLGYVNGPGWAAGMPPGEDPEGLSPFSLATANLSVPRRALASLRGFDVDLPSPRAQELDFAVQLAEAGLRFVRKREALIRLETPGGAASLLVAAREAGRGAALVLARRPELEGRFGMSSLSLGRISPARLSTALVRRLDPMGVSLPGVVYERALRGELGRGFLTGKGLEPAGASTGKDGTRAA